MSVSTANIIDLAKSLQSGSLGEIEQRAAIGRAYYAAYHDCKSWHDTLQSPGSAGIDGGVHARLISALSNPTVLGASAVNSKRRGYSLRALKALRAKADYELTLTVTADEAKQSIADAVKIMNI